MAINLSLNGMYAKAPRLLPDGGTVLILGSGPSLTQADVDVARSHVDLTIAVNDSYTMAPDADILYAGDAHWWKWHGGCRTAHTHHWRDYPAFTGRYKASMLAMERVPYPEVLLFKPGPQTGLNHHRDTLNRGYNSAYQSINLAVHCGATRIVLLGVDMQPGQRFRDGAWRVTDHFFGRHSDDSKPDYVKALEAFPTLIAPLSTLGIEVVNCTPGSALRCFPMQTVRERFPEAVAV